MTVLSVIQDATLYLGIDKPSAVYGQNTRTELELAEMVNDCAIEIRDAYDWQEMIKIVASPYVPTGDGSTTAFNLPADFIRMGYDTQVWSSSLETPLTHIVSRDKWLQLDVQSYDFVINAWTIYNDLMYIRPAMASGVTAKFWYVHNKLFTNTGGTDITKAMADTDTFRMSERLLKKCLIYTWKKSKGMAYGEEQADYNLYKEKLITSNRGTRMLHVGQPRFGTDLKTVYPTTISG